MFNSINERIKIRVTSNQGKTGKKLQQEMGSKGNKQKTIRTYVSFIYQLFKYFSIYYKSSQGVVSMDSFRGSIGFKVSFQVPRHYLPFSLCYYYDDEKAMHNKTASSQTRSKAVILTTTTTITTTTSSSCCHCHYFFHHHSFFSKLVSLKNVLHEDSKND